MTWGGRCPYCKEFFRGRADGKTMGEHKTPWYPLGGGNWRESCPYGGGTQEDAAKRITPMMRRTQAFIVRDVRAGKPMTENERALLIKRGMLEETLEKLAYDWQGFEPHNFEQRKSTGNLCWLCGVTRLEHGSL